VAAKSHKEKVYGQLRKKPKTAKVIGEALGYDGRGVGKALGQLVDEGRAEKHTGRPPEYTKV